MTPSRDTTGYSPVHRAKVLDGYRRHVNSSLGSLCDLLGSPLQVRAEGTKVYDEKNAEYLDCGGFGVFLLGHRHPVVMAAVQRQLDACPQVTRPLLSPVLAEAAAALSAVTPPGLDHVFLTNSGTEAVELGLKLARLQGKTRIIAMRGGFHGKTLGALSVTGRDQYRTPFEPLLPGVEFATFGDVDDIDRRLAHDGERTCVITEPIQGEGGVKLPPRGWLRHVRERCTEVGATLVLDEIQSGLGRTGAWWAAGEEGVVADVLLAGKVLSGGVMPIGAVIATTAAFAPLDEDPMLHSSTFGGSPLAAAAATATIDVLCGGLVERSAHLGAELLQLARDAVAAHCPHLVNEVRGRGLLIGVDFVSGDLAVEFLMALLDRRVVSSYSLNNHNVLRLTPPATLDAGDVAWLRDALEHAAKTLGASHRGAPSAPISPKKVAPCVSSPC